MDTIKVGINGFGRIGKLFFRSLFENARTRGKLEVVAINDLLSPEQLAYLLTYDSVHGQFQQAVRVEGNTLIVGEWRIRLSSERDPAAIDWGAVGAEYVIESTGLFLTQELAMGHLKAGARRVIMSAPAKDATPLFVLGVNEREYNPKTMQLVSNASCTTNCLAPVVKVVHDKWTILEGLMTTVHAATASQAVVDGGLSKKDWRGGRSVLNNIIPASTGAAKAIGRVIPELNGKLTGMSFRLPSANVSVVDLTCRLERPAKLAAICEAMQQAAQGPLKGILKYTEDAVVSQDFLHDAHTSIFDAGASIALNEHFVKLVSWYDNEWAYANKVGELCVYMASRAA